MVQRGARRADGTHRSGGPRGEADAIRIAKAPEPARAAARLKLNDAVKTVIAEGLDLLGVAAPDKM